MMPEHSCTGVPSSDGMFIIIICVNSHVSCVAMLALASRIPPASPPKKHRVLELYELQITWMQWGVGAHARKELQ